MGWTWFTWRRPYPMDIGMIVAGALLLAGVVVTGYVTARLITGLPRGYVHPVLGVLAVYGILVLFLVYTWRFCRIGLYVNERGLLVRYMTATRRLDWSSVRKIETARIRLGGGSLFFAVLIVPTRGRKPLIAPVWCRMATGRSAVGRDTSSRYVRRISFEAYQEMVAELCRYRRTHARVASGARVEQLADPLW